MKKRIENTAKEHPWRQWFAIGIIVLSTVIVYHNSLSAPFILDDDAKIVRNTDIQNLSNLKTKLIYPYNKQYYNAEQYHNFNRSDPSRPLVYLTFTLNYYFGGLNTFGYHLFNLLVHILNAILLFFLAKKIILYLYKKDSIGFPLFVALFFAIHPINTSVVTYIFGRSDLLAAFFYILSLLLFTKTFEKNKGLYVLSLMCFIFSLASKQIAVTLPAVILIFDYIFLNDYSIKKTIEKKYYHIPFWVLLIAYLLFRYFYLGGIGDVEAGATWARHDYLIIQPYIILRYLKLLIIPIGLCIDHVIAPMKIFGIKTIISFLAIIIIFLLTYKTYKEKTDNSKVILFSVLWFLIILSPTSSFFPTTSAFVENRLYLSGLGFYFFITFLYFKIFKIDFQAELNIGNNWILLSILSLHIFLLGFGTIKQNQLYQQPILMWQNVISHYPDNTRAHYNLGVLFKDSKRYDEAEKEFREAIRLNPGNAEVHYSFGVSLYNSNRYDEAEREYREAMRINPNYAEAHNNLGVLLDDLKRFGEAEKEYRASIRLDPNNDEVRDNLGVLLCNLGKYNEAEKEYRDAIRINPNNAVVHYNLGLLLHKSKSYYEAEKEYREAVRINPNYVDAHYNLGILYFNLKENKKALQEFEIALELSPNDIDIQNKVKLLKQ